MAIVFGSPEAQRILEANRRFITELNTKRAEWRKRKRELEKQMLRGSEDKDELLRWLFEWQIACRELAKLRAPRKEKAGTFTRKRRKEPRA